MAEPVVETRFAWPGGARRAITLSFDAETLWIGRDRANWKRSVGVASVGHRSPAGETGDNMVRLLTGRDFTWGSLFGLVMHPPVTGRQIADAWAAQEGRSP